MGLMHSCRTTAMGDVPGYGRKLTRFEESELQPAWIPISVERGSPPVTVPDDVTKNQFLRTDLRDALRWLPVGAVTSKAARTQPHRCGNQDALAMFTSLTQARALYEFFYAPAKQDDDARASHFASTWEPLETDSYRNYMAGGKPANKLVFHLVYNRPTHSGGLGDEGPDHLKNQVFEFVRDICKLTEDFARNADPGFRDSVGFALEGALKEAKLAADHYGIANPF